MLHATFDEHEPATSDDAAQVSTIDIVEPNSPEICVGTGPYTTPRFMLDSQ